jgi:hypothetical protein
MKKWKIDPKVYWKASGKMNAWSDLGVDKNIILKYIFHINIVLKKKSPATGQGDPRGSG